MRRALLIAMLAAAALAAPAAGQPRLLMPGVSYDRQVEFTLHGPVVVHVIEAPRPTGLYALRPVLARNSVRGRERVTSIERRLSSGTTVAGVNGDRFGANGPPNGLFIQDRVMQVPPLGTRSSLGIDAAGTLSVDRVPFFGDWRANGPRRALNTLNEPVGGGGTALFTSAWAGPTPLNADAVEAVLRPFPAATPNTELQGTVVQLLRGGNHVVPPDGAIVYARGNAATRLASEAVAGRTLTLRLILPSPLSAATNAIGGGPLLVRNGRPVFRANEAFENSWLIPRTARTAVGQRADGRILLVTVDGGRPGYSVGMTNFEFAQALARMGAVTAMALDGGASTTMAFDGDLLNRPAKAERAVADALVLAYSGVYAPPPSQDVLSPIRDERQALAYKLVRAATVDAVLDGPGGAKVTLDSGRRGPGTYRFSWRGVDGSGDVLPEGRWTWRVSAADDLGRSSSAERAFSLNITLRALTVDPAVLRPGGSVRIAIDLTRPAKLIVRVERAGAVVRTLVNRQASTGRTTVAWNGKLVSGGRAHPGTYVVRAVATNQIGTAELTTSVRRARR